jgi:hypothetical protein
MSNDKPAAGSTANTPAAASATSSNTPAPAAKPATPAMVMLKKSLETPFKR